MHLYWIRSWLIHHDSFFSWYWYWCLFISFRVIFWLETITFYLPLSYHILNKKTHSICSEAIQFLIDHVFYEDNVHCSAHLWEIRTYFSEKVSLICVVEVFFSIFSYGSFPYAKHMKMRENDLKMFETDMKLSFHISWYELFYSIFLTHMQNSLIWKVRNIHKHWPQLILNRLYQNAKIRLYNQTHRLIYLISKWIHPTEYFQSR